MGNKANKHKEKFKNWGQPKLDIQIEILETLEEILEELKK